MAENKIVHYIPPLPPMREKRVGICSRVSTNSAEQLKSLTAQVSVLTRLNPAVTISSGGSNRRLLMAAPNCIIESAMGIRTQVMAVLLIEESEAKNVRLIFNMYLQGKSVIGEEVKIQNSLIENQLLRS